MSLLPGAELLRALGATWPPAALVPCGPFLLRDGRGGGSRVSAATAEGAFTAADLDLAEAGMIALGQVPLFMVRGGEVSFDTLLAARGYVVKDPVVGYVGAVDVMAGTVPPETAFEVWPPLAVQTEIWAGGHVGPERLAIMARVKGPKVTLLGRVGDTPAGTAFVACDGRVAFLHALEVREGQRRNGLGGRMVQAAANWAARQGAGVLALVVTEANAVARRVYARLGMEQTGQYHYRIRPGGPA
jgi:N-acetylglutamate synthase